MLKQTFVQSERLKCGLPANEPSQKKIFMQVLPTGRATISTAEPRGWPSSSINGVSGDHSSTSWRAFSNETLTVPMRIPSRSTTSPASSARKRHSAREKRIRTYSPLLRHNKISFPSSWMFSHSDGARTRHAVFSSFMHQVVNMILSDPFFVLIVCT